MKINFLALVLIICLLQSVSAQEVLSLEKDEDANLGTLESLSWIAGYWKGTGLGGDCDELWLPAVDNSMIGTFRFSMDGKVIFTEFMNIIEENGRLYLKLKHFNRDLSGWEDKQKWTEFKFINSEGQTAYFNGLTFHREGDKMVLRLAITQNGQRTIEEFVYHKTSL